METQEHNGQKGNDSSGVKNSGDYVLKTSGGLADWLSNQISVQMLCHVPYEMYWVELGPRW